MMLAALVFLSYTIVAVATAAIAQKRYVRAAGSCALFMLVNFYLTRHIVEAHGTTELVMYIIGGMCGDMSGIFLTKYFDKNASNRELV